MELSEVKCVHFKQNNQCIGARCPFKWSWRNTVKRYREKWWGIYFVDIAKDHEFRRGSGDGEFDEAIDNALETLYKLFEIVLIHDGVSDIIVKGEDWIEQYNYLWDYLVYYCWFPNTWISRKKCDFIFKWFFEFVNPFTCCCRYLNDIIADWTI